ncbi:HGxxPAAW family protein [Streptomyces sp. NPDC007346]|uniref:HGxxPAAW family protein n=1 Tax=Streptomyces sp. NPDC007346 TaxID=3154682 RepID=UPI003454429E
MSAHGHVDMGHTVAGWAGTATAVVGFTVLGVAVAAVSVPIALAGAGITLGAVLLTWLLHLAGWGKPSGPRPESAWSWKVRDRSAGRGHPDCLGCRLAGRRAGAPEKASSTVVAASTVTG